MKLLRLCLLVVLAVLLPIRGAMAAAMLCPPMGAGTFGEMRVMDHRHDGEQPVHEHHHAHHDASHHDDTPSPGHDKCTLCAAFCSITPLLSAMPGVPPPLDVGEASFPGFSAPAPSFVSGGQERPPRSI